ncbi:MAG: helix-hairpin-helix domain-containing protein [Pedobacter sp.]|nr:MAG: helix-hairpin-helix domain-containing protein [Pedobacter sp.]
MPAICQEDQRIKDLVEIVAEQSSEDFDSYEFTERLMQYRSDPLNLNRASEIQLRELMFLSPLQISNILLHIAKNGKLLNLLELQGIEGFDLQTVEMLSMFAYVGDDPALFKLSKKALLAPGNNDLMIRYGSVIQQSKGFTDLPGSRYLGSKDKMLLRYRYNLNKTLSVGLVMEKDAGEYWFRGKLGSDHLSGNIAAYDVGVIKKLIVGDYSLQFGQGLTLWSGFAFGKGPDVTSVATRALGLRPYAAANEASFFRGIATTIGIAKNFSFTPFISDRKRDASLKMLPDSTYTLQTLNISGLHRTKTEQFNHNSVGQQVYGAVANFGGDNLSLGMIGYRTTFEHSFVSGSQLYNAHSFTGKSLTNAGVNYSFTFRNIYGYGELAHSIGSGWAALNGLLVSLSPRVSSVLLYRKYQKDYHNFFSNGVGENTEVSNEQGFYFGINYVPSKHFFYSVYVDYFKFPWLKYRVDEPSSGFEVLGQFIYTPTKTTKLLVRIKRELKVQNADASDPVKGMKEVCKQSLRIGGDWNFSSSISFQHRIELSYFKKGTSAAEIGRMTYSDLNFKKSGFRLSGNFRVAYFNTPSYNSRIYAYEDDVLYGSASGVYADKGFRSYLNARYQLKKGIDFWLRYALYNYYDTQTIGSGLDEIIGNKKSDVKFQFRYQF